MLHTLAAEPEATEASAEASFAPYATPLLLKMRETLPDLKALNLTDTGRPTDVPPNEIWDMDYDQP